MKSGRFVSTVLAVMMVFGGLVAATPQANAEPIKIGCVFAITGPASWLGEPEANTARMIVEKVNAAGGIKGNKIELLVEDSQGDETRAKNAVQKLIREGVVAIIGPSRSGTTMAVVGVCTEQKIPLISCAAASVITSPPDGERYWVFKTPQKDSHAVQRIYEYMLAHDMKTVGLITGTTGFGDAGRKQLKAFAEQYGIKIVADETYGPRDTDMTPQLTKINAANPAAIVNWSIVPAQSIVMKNMKTLGMKAQLFQSHGFGNHNYVKAAGAAADGVVFPAGPLLVADELPNSHPQKKLLVGYKNEYEKKYGGNVSTFGGHAYDALQLVLEACEKKGATREAIRGYIEQRKGYIGTGGAFNFSAEDHTGLNKDTCFEMLSV